MSGSVLHALMKFIDLQLDRRILKWDILITIAAKQLITIVCRILAE